jgi:hypothetical protein
MAIEICKVSLIGALIDLEQNSIICCRVRKGVNHKKAF